MGEKQLLKSEFLFYNANILKIMMTWKIVGTSKVSVLYIYIYRLREKNLNTKIMKTK